MLFKTVRKKNLPKLDSLEDKSWNSHYDRQKKRYCAPSREDSSLIVFLIFPSEKEKMSFAFDLKTKLWVAVRVPAFWVDTVSEALLGQSRNLPSS